jgi:hypothetical protein
VTGPCAVCGRERPRGGLCAAHAAEVRRQRRKGAADPVAAARVWYAKHFDRRCAWCGEPIGSERRLDARFCSDAHKARAGETQGILRLARTDPTQAYAAASDGPLASGSDPTASLLRRVLEKVDLATASEETCWVWSGTLSGDGAGLLRRNGKLLGANRVVFELFEGGIPAGLVIARSCSNPRCVNPAHLEALDPVVHRERNRRRPQIGDRGSESERFWRKVDRGAAEECWPWLASTARGYPQFRLPGQEGKIGGHVWAYRDRFGPVPAGFEVHHACGNRRCVNPEHLRALPPPLHNRVDRERREVAAA